MKAIDLRHVYKKYKGLWVALINDTEVISADKSVRKVVVQAKKKGYENPLLFKVPNNNLPFVRSKHTLPYRFIDDTKFLRPYIPVTLRHQTRVMQPMLALVDSGADFCLFDGELSYLLDLDLTKLEKINLSGVAGMATGHIAHIEIGINDTFIPVPAVFSFDFSPKGFGGIIGQVGFFDRLIVEFDRAHKQVVLK